MKSWTQPINTGMCSMFEINEWKSKWKKEKLLLSKQIFHVSRLFCKKLLNAPLYLCSLYKWDSWDFIWLGSFAKNKPYGIHALSVELLLLFRLSVQADRIPSSRIYYRADGVEWSPNWIKTPHISVRLRRISLIYSKFITN